MKSFSWLLLFLTLSHLLPPPIHSFIINAPQKYFLFKANCNFLCIIIMTSDICIVCLTKIPVRFSNIPDFDTYSKRQANKLRTKFLKFVNNYLKIPTTGFNSDKGTERKLFCTTCEAVVGQVCDLYLEYLDVELRLSDKLGLLGRLLESSQPVERNALTLINCVESLSNQLGIKGTTSPIYQLRSLLTSKCNSSRKIE